MPRRFSPRPYHASKRKADQLPIPTGRKRTSSERMNKGEAAYAQALEADPHVVAYWFEGLSWRLADDTHYKPDFVVLLDDGRVELHEVKAATAKGQDFGVTPDSWVKIKVAAKHAPFPVVVVWQHQGSWKARRMDAA